MLIRVDHDHRPLPVRHVLVDLVDDAGVRSGEGSRR